MSRRLGAILIGMAAAAVHAQSYGPPVPKAPTITPAEAASIAYERRYGPQGAAKPCRPTRGDEIVVCGDKGGESPYRLPLRDDRFAEGEVVRHASEPAAATAVDASPGCHRPGCADPSKLVETIVKLFHAANGDDPR